MAKNLWPSTLLTVLPLRVSKAAAELSLCSPCHGLKRICYARIQAVSLLIPRGVVGQASKGQKREASQQMLRFFLAFYTQYFCPLLLAERRNSLLEGQMVYIYLWEMIRGR